MASPLLTLDNADALVMDPLFAYFRAHPSDLGSMRQVCSHWKGRLSDPIVDQRFTRDLVESKLQGMTQAGDPISASKSFEELQLELESMSEMTPQAKKQLLQEMVFRPEATILKDQLIRAARQHLEGKALGEMLALIASRTGDLPLFGEAFEIACGLGHVYAREGLIGLIIEKLSKYGHREASESRFGIAKEMWETLTTPSFQAAARIEMFNLLNSSSKEAAAYFSGIVSDLRGIERDSEKKHTTFDAIRRIVAFTNVDEHFLQYAHELFLLLEEISDPENPRDARKLCAAEAMIGLLSTTPHADVRPFETILSSLASEELRSGVLTELARVSSSALLLKLLQLSDELVNNKSELLKNLLYETSPSFYREHCKELWQLAKAGDLDNELRIDLLFRLKWALSEPAPEPFLDYC